jgi:hypothetical protein
MGSWDSYMATILKLTPLLIKAGEEIAPLAVKLVTSIRGSNVPTVQDWADLDALEKRLRDELHAPLD